MIFAQPGENGWIFRRGCFTVDADAVALQLGLYVHDTVGTVWFDDIRFRAMEGDRVSVDSMYVYYPVQVKLGAEMVRRFNRLAAAERAALDRAKQYNRLLVDVARAGEDARRLQRSAGYLSGLGSSAEIAAEMARAQDAEDRLDELYQSLWPVVRRRAAPTDWRASIAQAQSPGRPGAASRRQIADRLQALQDSARELAGPWPKLPEPEARPVVIAADGKPNQIVIGTRSPYSHFELEEPLGINRLHSVTALYGQSEGPGRYDFRPDGDAWETLRKLGAGQATIDTPFALHDTQYAPEWFLKTVPRRPRHLDAIGRRGEAGPAAVRRGLEHLARRGPRHDRRRRHAIRPGLRLAAGSSSATSPPPRTWDPILRSPAACAPPATIARRWPTSRPGSRERYGQIAELNRQWKSGYRRIRRRPPARRPGDRRPVAPPAPAGLGIPGLARRSPRRLAEADLPDAQAGRPGQAGDGRP